MNQQAMSPIPQTPPTSDEVPLVWTTKGNIPESQLTYTTRWVVDKNFIKFIEIHTLNGEVVRESAHVLSRIGFDPSVGETQSLN